MGECPHPLPGEGIFFLNQGGILKVQSLTNLWIVYFTCQSAVTYIVLSGSHIN